MTNPEMTCQELVELVTDYFEDALPAPDKLRFEAHLHLCSDCEAYVDQLRLTVRLAGRLSTSQITEDVRDKLLAAFRGWKQS